MSEILTSKFLAPGNVCKSHCGHDSFSFGELVAYIYTTKSREKKDHEKNNMRLLRDMIQQVCHVALIGVYCECT